MPAKRKSTAKAKPAAKRKPATARKPAAPAGLVQTANGTFEKLDKDGLPERP